MWDGVFGFWLLLCYRVAAALRLQRAWCVQIPLYTLKSCKHNCRHWSQSPSDSDPTHEVVELALWCLRLWRFLEAEWGWRWAVLGGCGEEGRSTQWVSEPPCGPPNLHLMPVIRFQSWVFWEHPSCCKWHVYHCSWRVSNEGQSWFSATLFRCRPAKRCVRPFMQYSAYCKLGA